MTADGLSLYFSSMRTGQYLIYRATRPDVTLPFDAPTLVTELNAAGAVFGAISGDDLAFYFNQSTGSDDDVFVMTRSSPLEPFANPTPVPTLSTGRPDFNAAVASGGLFATVTQEIDATDRILSLYARGQVDAPWQSVGGLAEIHTPYWESAGSLSPDGLTIVFHSNRDTMGGVSDLHSARRNSIADDFDMPRAIVELNTADHETDPFLSADQLTIVYIGGGQLLAATRAVQ